MTVLLDPSIWFYRELARSQAEKYLNSKKINVHTTKLSGFKRFFGFKVDTLNFAFKISGDTPKEMKIIVVKYPSLKNQHVGKIWS